MVKEPLRRRRVLVGSASVGIALLAGCLGDDSDATDENDGREPVEDDTDDDDDDAGHADDAHTVALPTDPDEDEYVDRSGEGTVEIITREGTDDESDFVFDPPFVAVDPGTTVRWVNEDGVFHTVTSTPDLENRQGGEVFDAEIAAEGDTFEWEATEPGLQHYFCEPHVGFMWGSIAILDDGSFPTDDDSPGADDQGDEDPPDDDPDDAEFTTVPDPLPTDPDDDDFVDRTGNAEIEIITREGRENEPNFVFDPPFVRVDAGTTVRWVNQDGVFHTITSTDSLDSRSGGGDDFDATISSVGDEFEWTAADEGRQGYYCSPHAGFMFGALEIG